MNKVIDVRFQGGKKVDAQINGVVIHTDQATENGGEGTAPEPFHLFVGIHCDLRRGLRLRVLPCP